MGLRVLKFLAATISTCRVAPAYIIRIHARVSTETIIQGCILLLLLGAPHVMDAPMTIILVLYVLLIPIHACAATDKDRLVLSYPCPTKGTLAARIPLGAMDVLRATKGTTKRVALVQVAYQDNFKI